MTTRLMGTAIIYFFYISRYFRGRRIILPIALMLPVTNNLSLRPSGKFTEETALYVNSSFLEIWPMICMLSYIYIVPQVRKHTRQHSQFAIVDWVGIANDTP